LLGELMLSVKIPHALLPEIGYKLEFTPVI
jgi:hypothetical protein